MKRSDVYLGAAVKPSAAYVDDLLIRTAEADHGTADVLAKAAASVDSLAESVAKIEARLARLEANERGHRHE
jgi:hypothetical protein